MGGTYAYNMGYLSNGHLVANTLGAREDFALVADAPGDMTRPPHDGKGVNVLYEDGHYRFLPKLHGRPAGVGDDPFHNRKGYSAAGLDPNDAALGPSDAHPLPYND